MKRYGLGIDEATKAIIINKAMRRSLSDATSPARAIELLASKISLVNLLYESSDEDPNSDDDLSSIRPDLIRVEPVPEMDHRLASRPMKPSTQGRKSKSATVKAAKPRSSKTPSKNGAAGRKRTIEEMTPILEKRETTTRRERSDSVTAEVDAKIAKSNEESTVNDNVIRPTPGGRAKRVHRTDESSETVIQSSSHKRMRGTEG
jgi:hypothetical protein